MGNIRDKGFIDGQGIKDFDKLFDILESIQKKRRIENQDVEFQSKMDSSIDEYGSLNDLDVELMFDKQRSSAGFLSANIDYAFKVKSEKAWLKNVSHHERAVKLKIKGMSVEEIAEITELTVQEIVALV